MDEPLIAADPSVARRWMAARYLEGPGVSTRVGAITLQPHQADAVSRLLATLEETGGAVLADATGMGKTFTAIAVARAIGPAVVVAPAALRPMWHRALDRTSTAADFTSFESLSRGGVSRQRPALVVVDEAHHARNPRTRRYAALADLAWGARVLLLTATPVHNRGRDLRALLALYLGSRAWDLSRDEVGRCIVRRQPADASASAPLPALDPPQWLVVPSDRATLAALMDIPEAVPSADGKAAHALMVLGLLRAWSSSTAALRAMLRRRLQRAVSLSIALESGRVPGRRELASTLVIDDAVQLGFAELTAVTGAVDTLHLREALALHCEGVRSAMRAIDQAGDADGARTHWLRKVCDRHAPVPVVAFTQFTDTAGATYRVCLSRGGVALVSGRGARIASGRITVDEVVRGFDVDAVDARERPPRSMPFNLLVTTDVLSEGLSLRRAGVIVHLDLPWTVARLEQRTGRLRRPGSPHRRIAIYAIGPPVSARELTAVVRALQRKARLSAVAGMGDTVAGMMPLVGNRLAHATAAIATRGDAHADEEVRTILSRWSVDKAEKDQPGSIERTALALVVSGSRTSLLAVRDGQAAAGLSDIRHVVRLLDVIPGSEATVAPASIASCLATVGAWIEHRRARALAGPAVESPSVAHTAVLRRLQTLAARTGRAERAVIIERIERCRGLVLAARGIGAENAMAGFIARSATAGGFDLAALELLLVSRNQVHTATGAPRLVALLVGEGKARSALVAADLASVLGRDRAEGAESGDRVPLGPDPDPSRRGDIQGVADREGGVPGQEPAHPVSAHLDHQLVPGA